MAVPVEQTMIKVSMSGRGVSLSLAEMRLNASTLRAGQADFTLSLFSFTSDTHLYYGVPRYLLLIFDWPIVIKFPCLVSGQHSVRGSL